MSLFGWLVGAAILDEWGGARKGAISRYEML